MSRTTKVDPSKGSPASGERSEPLITKCLNCNRDYDQHTQGTICPHDIGGPNSLAPWPPQRSEPRGQQQEWTQQKVHDFFECRGTTTKQESYRDFAIVINAELAAVRTEELAECRALTHDTICDLQDKLAAERADHTQRMNSVQDFYSGQLSTEHQSREQAERDIITWRSLAQEMTPGSSEFMTPDAVRAYYRRQKDETHEAKKDRAKINQQLLSALAAIEKARKVLEHSDIKFRSAALMALETINLSLLHQHDKELLLSYEAAIEKHNAAVDEWKACSSSPDNRAFLTPTNKIDIDLSVLHKHDDKVRSKADKDWREQVAELITEHEQELAEVRKPLVDALRTALLPIAVWKLTDESEPYKEVGPDLRKGFLDAHDAIMAALAKVNK